MYKFLFFLLLLCVLYRGWKENKVRGFFSSLAKVDLWLLLLFSLLLLPLDFFVFIPSAKGFLTYVSKLGNLIGDVEVVLPILLAILCFSSILKLKKAEELLLELICLVVLISLLGNLFKIILGRARPYMGAGDFSFFNFPESLFKNGFQSFPSGHVFFATSLFGWFGLRFGGWVKWLSLIMIVIVAYNRLESHSHFFSDVAFSFAFGYFLLLGYLREVRGTEKVSLSLGALFMLSLFPFFKRLFSGERQDL